MCVLFASACNAPNKRGKPMFRIDYSTVDSVKSAWDVLNGCLRASMCWIIAVRVFPRKSFECRPRESGTSPSTLNFGMAKNSEKDDSLFKFSSWPYSSVKFWFYNIRVNAKISNKIFTVDLYLKVFFTINIKLLF